jgi:malonyl CoA-acyl carrier protein transacylase
MEPIINEFSEVISESTFCPPDALVISNVSSQPLTDADSIKEELLKQLQHCI